VPRVTSATTTSTTGGSAPAKIPSIKPSFAP
jgi:hypothetical protein